MLDDAAARAVALAARLRAGELTPCPQTCSRDGCRVSRGSAAANDACDAETTPSDAPSSPRSSATRSSAATATCCSTPARAAARRRCWSSGSCARCSRTASTVGAILTITFTEKAAAELRERIRARLRELGADEAARATEGAFISTIHGFCARRAAGARARGGARSRVRRARRARGRGGSPTRRSTTRWRSWPRDEPGGVELIAAYTPAALRAAIRRVLRRAALARADRAGAAGAAAARRGELAAARRARGGGRGASAAELGAIAEPGVAGRARRWSGSGAAARLLGERDDAVARRARRGCALPGGNGAALSDAGVRGLRARRSTGSGRRASTVGRSGCTSCSTGCCAASARATRGSSASARRSTSRIWSC